MKRLSFLLLAAVLLTGSLVTSKAAVAGEPARQVAKAVPTEVYYFHLSRRCTTCQTVEKVSQEAVTEFFAEAVKKGEVTFKAVNLEDKENKALVKKLKVQGQSLLIVNGQDQINITDKGFMYAMNEPDKLKAEIKAGVEKFKK